MRRLFWVCLFGVVTLAAATPPALPPADDGAKDPSFVAFRKELLRAIERKDAKALMSMLDPKIKTGFGGGGGVKEFELAWKPGPNSEVWKQLGDVLALGTRATKDRGFVAPSMFADFEKVADEYDSFESVVAVRNDVAVRAKPDPKSTKLTVLSYQVVKLADDQKNVPEAWRRVTLPDKRTGYVMANEVRSPVAYRAFFAKKAGVWKMVAFVEGD
jgi:hypothetical protein